MAALELINTTLFNDPNLVYYWRMKGNSNDSKDSNNGTDTAITYSAGNGKFGQGAGFNGTTSKIVLTSYPTSGGTAFTINLWIYLTGGSGTRRECVTWGNFTNTDQGISLLVNTSNHIEMDSTSTVGPTNTVNLQDSAWHMVTGVYDGVNLIVYVDGANAASLTRTLNIGIGEKTLGDLSITASFFYGNEDDVAIFNRALTATEISNHYNGLNRLSTATGFFLNFV